MPFAVARSVIALGANIRRARLRRGMKQADLAKKTGLALGTLKRLEEGSPTTAISAYFVVLWALGLEREFVNLASPDRDEEGKTLEAARQPTRARASSRLDDDF
ncbi:helix-turn-helix transcriptional regulator [Myxococcus sp. MISCRS1]|uniref:helix-turn-helix domain-containing protein n=1 Tax=unclassified Myxococcus TaxID=2648731 RepID=UPI001CC02FC3|nr:MULTISPECIES: helix-turn-helix transcriptional regulator [unclassified Myxococcus]MCY0999780.1 helix-turn-helix transcriptional regulator [Myxococcus sp. MISCRS1]BDT30469.1 helix-turn-helix transcriptional regulator [Myxococcus sp. MH1]